MGIGKKFASMGMRQNLANLLGGTKLPGQIPNQIYESAIEKGIRLEKGETGVNETYRAILDGVSGFYKPQLGNMETKREMFGSIFSRALGLLAPANVPVVTGNFLRPGGIFSPDVAAQGGSLLKNIKGSTTGIFGEYDKLSSVEEAISSGYRAAMMSAMRYVDGHDGNLVLNPITKQPGLIDFGMILDFYPKGAGSFIPSMFSPLRQHVPNLVDAVADPKRQAFFEGLLKAKDVLSGLSRSDIKDMLKSAGYKGIDLNKKLKIVTNSIKDTVNAMPSAVDDALFDVPDAPSWPSNAMIGPDGKITLGKGKKGLQPNISAPSIKGFPSFDTLFKTPKGFPSISSLPNSIKNVRNLWSTPKEVTGTGWSDVAGKIIFDSSTINPVVKNIRKLWNAKGFSEGGPANALSNLGVPMFEDGINMVPANMLALLHKNEAVVPANMNPFNPNASAAVSGSVYNINVELNGTTVTAKDVALEIRNEMRIKEMAAGVNRTVGRS